MKKRIILLLLLALAAFILPLLFGGKVITAYHSEGISTPNVFSLDACD